MTVSRARAGIALSVLSLTYLLSYMDRTVLAVLQEGIKAEFQLSDTQLGLLGGPAFAILYSIMGLPIARLADRFDRGRLIAACVFAWSLMTALCGIATNYLQLLLARAGVSVGEAGGNPASHSLIADLYPPEARARAVSVYTLGVPLGAFLGSALGGLLAQAYGWRTTFIVLGAAGGLLTALVLATIRNVPRGTYDTAASNEEKTPSARDVLRVLLANRAFIHLAAGSSLVVLIGYALPAFLASFAMRVHDLPVAQAGLVTGIVMGAGGLLGTIVAGIAADRLGARNRAWYGWISGIAMVIAFPALTLGLLADDIVIVTALLTIGMALMFIYIPPTFAMIHGMVTARMRATATSVFYLIINLIGLGIGPPLVGWLSDRLAHHTMGGDFARCSSVAADTALAAECGDALAFGIRYALLAINVILVWSAFHYWRAGLILGQDDTARTGRNEWEGSMAR